MMQSSLLRKCSSLEQRNPKLERIISLLETILFQDVYLLLLIHCVVCIVYCGIIGPEWRLYAIKTQQKTQNAPQWVILLP